MFDAATNRSIWLHLEPRGDDGRYRGWTASRDELFRAQFDEGPSLIDYGLLGAAERFEAWASVDAWRRSVAFDGRCTREVGENASIADRPAIAALAELFECTDMRRGSVACLRAESASALASAVLVLARLARLNGFVPLAAQAIDTCPEALGGRSLFLIDDGSVLMPGVRVALRSALAHVRLRVGRDEAAGMQNLALGPAHVGHHARTPARSARLCSRVAEQRATYEIGGSARALLHSPSPDPASESAPERERADELTALRRRMDRSDALLAAGRHAPGFRLLRQAVGGFARREAWSNATRGALTLAAELMKRGRPRHTLKALNDAGRYAERANDPGSLLDVAVLTGEAWIDAARLDEGERVLTAALTAAREAHDRPRELVVSTSLARCLFWRAEYTAAAACVETQTSVTLAPSIAIRRLRMVARIAAARGDCALALSALEEARALVPCDGPSLQADIDDTSAFVKLGIGDYDAVDRHVACCFAASRPGRHSLRKLSVRLLQAEADRRRTRRLPESAARMLGRLSAAAPPVLKARWDLFSALCTGADVRAVTARQAAVSGLKALELFAVVTRAAAPGGSEPIVGDVVSILELCQHAEDEAALLRDVCARLRERLRAAAAAVMAPADRGCLTIAADGARVEAEIARRAFELGVAIMPVRDRERIESATIVRYGGKPIAALCVRWTIGTTEDLSRAAGLLSLAAVAVGPLVAAFLARRSQSASAPTLDLLGVTPRVVELRREIERAAVAPFPVLIEGESGSGKELVARAIHRAGSRRDRSFSTLNCAALPDDLVEAELFGHARGSFTGALADRPGVFEEAHGGTLFLDEVGELSPRAQAKVLRVIQGGELRRVGENISRRVDVRIVTATNRDLRHEVDAGRFRLDLMYRLDVIRIAVPPLRERSEDIAVLVDHFWSEATGRLGSRATLGLATRAALTSYSWPGNVRELQNVLAALAVRSPKRGVVPPSALPTHLAASSGHHDFRLESARRTFEEAFIRGALVRSGGHRGRAADELGLSRQGLTKLMTRLGIA